MIMQNCLKSVDEVYGLHNVPNFDEGDIRVCSGPIMASCQDVKIVVKGQGGHGSAPHKLIDPITCAN
jgi:hippurate hydrolase